MTESIDDKVKKIVEERRKHPEKDTKVVNSSVEPIFDGEKFKNRGET